jgi:hypothetical protein
MNATKLCADLYAVLDGVLETGKPVIIERKDRRLRLSVEETSGTEPSAQCGRVTRDAECAGCAAP